VRPDVLPARTSMRGRAAGIHLEPCEPVVAGSQVAGSGGTATQAQSAPMWSAEGAHASRVPSLLAHLQEA
jgi:hypothetical protein